MGEYEIRLNSELSKQHPNVLHEQFILDKESPFEFFMKNNKKKKKNQKI